MGNTENLSGSEAAQKIREIADTVNICLFASNLGRQPVSVVPMSVCKTEADGCLWFFSGKNSEHNQNIERDNKVQLFFSDKGKSEYLSLYGSAELSTDPKKIGEFWSPLAKTWFNGGKEDPDITLIKVTPESGQYWDTKHNKAVQMLKIVAGAVIGKPLDDGIQGRISS